MKSIKLSNILSHHCEDELYRCIHIKVFNNQIFICSRCLGYCLGFLLYLIIIALTDEIIFSEVLIILLPVPAFIDIILYKYCGWRGNNYIRFISGMMLGVVYPIFLWHILTLQSDIAQTLMGVTYTAVAIFLLKNRSTAIIR